MDELKKRRKEHGDIEKSQANLFNRHENLLMDRYYQGAKESSLDEIQFLYNNHLISETLIEWREKLKDKNKPDQKKILDKMIMASLEIMIHQQSFKIKLARSIVETQKWREQWNIQFDKNKKLQDEINALKAEKEFNNEN